MLASDLVTVLGQIAYDLTATPAEKRRREAEQRRLIREFEFARQCAEMHRNGSTRPGPVFVETLIFEGQIYNPPRRYVFG